MCWTSLRTWCRPQALVLWIFSRGWYKFDTIAQGCGYGWESISPQTPATVAGLLSKILGALACFSRGCSESLSLLPPCLLSLSGTGYLSTWKPIFQTRSVGWWCCRADSNQSPARDLYWETACSTHLLDLRFEEQSLGWSETVELSFCFSPFAEGISYECTVRRTYPPLRSSLLDRTTYECLLIPKLSSKSLTV